MAADYDDEVDERDPRNQEAGNRFLRGIEGWAAKYGLSSEAVIRAATEYSVGGTWSARFYVDADFDDLDFTDRTPSITARPHHETREEFLQRAGDYYDRMIQLYAKDGRAKGGPVQRTPDHYRYLGAHLVGRVSFAEIAREHSLEARATEQDNSRRSPSSRGTGKPAPERLGGYG